MSKFIQAFLSGMFFTFILDFFIFLGIFENYIKFNDINLYYNILFADNQNIFIFTFLTILLGYITLYKSTKLSLIILGTLFLFSFSTIISPIGNFLGEIVLMKKNVTINMKNYSYRGDVLYDGRKDITFYDYKFKKNLTLDKNKIVGKY